MAISHVISKTGCRSFHETNYHDFFAQTFPLLSDKSQWNFRKAVGDLKLWKGNCHGERPYFSDDSPEKQPWWRIFMKISSLDFCCFFKSTKKSRETFSIFPTQMIVVFQCDIPTLKSATFRRSSATISVISYHLLDPKTRLNGESKRHQFNKTVTINVGKILETYIFLQKKRAQNTTPKTFQKWSLLSKTSGDSSGRNCAKPNLSGGLV